MTVKVVPVLGGQGFLSDPYGILQQMFSYFLLSDKSQDSVFPNDISSLPYLVAINGNSPYDLKQNVEITLTKMYRRFFDTTDIAVSYTAVQTDGSYNINISVLVTLNGVNYSLQSAASVKDCILGNVIKDLGE